VSDAKARSNVDFVVTGCEIVTLDEENAVLRDGAIAIDSGRIVWIGNAADASAHYRGNSTIDGRNRIGIPGLIDAHLHTAQQLLVAANVIVGRDVRTVVIDGKVAMKEREILTVAWKRSAPSSRNGCRGSWSVSSGPSPDPAPRVRVGRER
jgi:cytosine/adenosine deaminase-related metal-dependent hydrolase